MLGTNLCAVKNWLLGEYFPFTDLMKGCTKPMRIYDNGSIDWNYDSPLETDKNGYPVNVDAPGLAVQLPKIPQGESYSDYTVFIDDKNGDRATTIPDSSGLLRLSARVDIKKIQVIPKSLDIDDFPTFRQDFLDALEGFEVLRFMDWQRTNFSVAGEWDDRNTPDGITQNVSRNTGNPQGVALEHMLELCEILDCGAWFCMPHGADDEYIDNFMEMCEDSEAKHFHFEHSNEVWNFAFSQYRECAKRGEALFGALENKAYAAYVYHAIRTVRIADGASMLFYSSERYKIVFGVGRDQTDSWRKPFKYSADASFRYLNKLEEWIDVVAPAQYFGGYLGNESSSQFKKRGVKPLAMSLDYILGECAWHVKQRRDRLEFIVQDVAKYTNATIGGYEAGHHLDTVKIKNKDEARHLDELFGVAAVSVGMGNLYRRMFEDWNELTGDGLLCVFQGPGIPPNGNYFSWSPGDSRHGAMMPWLPEPETVPVPMPVPTPVPTPPIPGESEIEQRLKIVELKQAGYDARVEGFEKLITDALDEFIVDSKKILSDVEGRLGSAEQAMRDLVDKLHSI